MAEALYFVISLSAKIIQKYSEFLRTNALVAKNHCSRNNGNVLTRITSTNVVTATAAFAVSVVPDAVRLCTGKISGKEFGKRTACNGTGAIGGTGGSWAGMAIGSLICPCIGTAIGGLIGGIAGGVGASIGIGALFQ